MFGRQCERSHQRIGKKADLRSDPLSVTARTLAASKAGRNVKRLASKEELFADLGL